MYSFEEKNASRGYHVFRNTTWRNAKLGDKITVMTETDKSSLDEDPYACTIKIKHRYFDTYLPVDHIPGEVSRYCFYYIKEGGVITGHVVSTNHKVSPIPAVVLEIPVLLTFSVEQKRIHEMMNEFVGYLYGYNYCAQKDNNDQINDDSDKEIIVSLK